LIHLTSDHAPFGVLKLIQVQVQIRPKSNRFVSGTRLDHPWSFMKICLQLFQ